MQRIYQVIERDWLPESAADLSDRIRVRYERRRESVEVARGPSWPQLWRNLLVDDVVAQTITRMESEGAHRPVRAITVVYREPERAKEDEGIDGSERPEEHAPRRFRLRPVRQDFQDLTTMLEARKSIYRALVEAAEGRGHQPPLSLHIAFVPGEPVRFGRPSLFPRVLRPDVAVELGLNVQRGPRGVDPGSVPTAPMRPEERGQMVKYRLVTGKQKVIELELDELRPIRRLTSHDLGIRVNEEVQRLEVEEKARSYDVDVAKRAIDSLEQGLPTLTGAALDRAQQELDDAYALLGRRSVAEFDATRRLERVTPQLLQFELRPRGRVRVRGLGCDLYERSDRKLLNRPRAKTTGGVTHLVDGTSLVVDGQETLAVQALEVAVG